MNRVAFALLTLSLPACVIKTAPANPPYFGGQPPAPPPTSYAATGNAEVPIDPSQPMPASSLGSDAALRLGAPAQVMLDGRSDIYSAGAATANPDRGGVLPTRITLAPGGSVITFERVVGKSGCMADAAFGPDGGDCAGGNTNLETAGTISGIVASDRTLFMVGVFLGKAAPTAPERLDFSPGHRGVDFAELAPAVGQVFFIGDGLTATGAQQRFAIPPGATELYLGYADGYAFQGTPAAYGDNTGGLSVSLTER